MQYNLYGKIVVGATIVPNERNYYHPNAFGISAVPIDSPMPYDVDIKFQQYLVINAIPDRTASRRSRLEEVVLRAL